MNHVSAFRLNTRAVLIAAIASVYPLQSWAAPAARVEFSTGNAMATGPDGQARRLTKGTEINAGDTINTADGRAQLRFTDGGLMSLSPDTEFRVDEYSYDGKQDGNEKSFFNLVKGGLRAITGAIGHTNKKNYKLNTPVATIGIRGTEFLATMRGRLLIRVGDGAVFVQNSKGDLVLYKGQSGEVNEGESPKSSDEQPIVNGPSPDIPFDYVAGNDTNQQGDPCLIAGGCAFETTLDGVSISQAWVDDYDGINSDAATFPQNASYTTRIVSDGQGVNRTIITQQSLGNTSVNVIQANADVVRDDFGSNGGLAWSRWLGGSYRETTTYNGVLTSNETYQHYASHFIWGSPTSPSDMVALNQGNFVANYSVSGYTTPTLTDTSTGLTTSVSGAVTGTMQVNFGSGYIDLALTVGALGTYYGSDTLIAGSSKFNLWGDLTAPGFFSGSNAAQAGLVYQKNIGSDVLSGAAGFNQTNLTVAPPY